MTAHVATGDPEPSTAHEETDMTTIDAPLRPTPEAPGAADAPNATGPRPARRFAAVLRSEWIKCHTVWATKALLAVNPRPSEAEILQALRYNLCRCGAHVEIVRAVMRAAGYALEARD